MIHTYIMQGVWDSETKITKIQEYFLFAGAGEVKASWNMTMSRGGKHVLRCRATKDVTFLEGFSSTAMCFIGLL